MRPDAPLRCWSRPGIDSALETLSKRRVPIIRLIEDRPLSELFTLLHVMRERLHLHLRPRHRIPTKWQPQHIREIRSTPRSCDDFDNRLSSLDGIPGLPAMARSNALSSLVGYCALVRLAHDVRRLVHGALEGCTIRAQLDNQDPDAERCELFGYRLGYAFQCELAAGVHALAGSSGEAGGGGDHDDGSAATLTE